MKIYQKYIGFQSYMGVTSKLSLPCPFQTQNGKGRGRPNFQATPSKFSNSIQLLKIFIDITMTFLYSCWFPIFKKFQMPSCPSLKGSVNRVILIHDYILPERMCKNFENGGAW